MDEYVEATDVVVKTDFSKSTKDFSNGLSAEELERLAYLSEECSEVIKACTKVIRHGYQAHNPDKPEDGTNHFQLENEIQDVLKAITLMFCKGDISTFPIPNTTFSMKYMHFQDKYPQLRDGFNKKES